MAIQEAVICKETNLRGDRGSEVINMYRSKRLGVRKQYPGADWTIQELILKNCHQILLFRFYLSENFESNLKLFPEFRSDQVCVRGIGGVNFKGLTKI